MSNALYQQTKGESNIRSIYNYAKKAYDGNQSDAKVKEFYNEVKVKYDKFMASKEEKKEESKNEEPVIEEVK